MKHGYNKHAFKEFSLTAKFMPMMTFLLSLKMYYIMKKINIVDKETEYHVKSLTHVKAVCAMIRHSQCSLYNYRY